MPGSTGDRALQPLEVPREANSSPFLHVQLLGSSQAHQVITASAKYCAAFYHLARIAFSMNHPDLETLVLSNAVARIWGVFLSGGADGVFTSNTGAQHC